MAEPTGSLLPTAYDSALSLLGTLVDHRNLELAVEIDADDTEIVTAGAVTDIPLPVYITFATGEIVFCETLRVGNNGWVNVLRGRRGTSGAVHLVGEAMWPAVSGKHVSLLRDALIAAQRCQGLYIPVAGLGSALAGGVVVTDDEHRVYFGRSAGWLWVGRESHGDLDDLGEDDHTQYHTDARAQTWHDGLTGAHVVDGDSHDHEHGHGIGRITGGLEAAIPVPTYERELYYATDTQILYISPDGLDWTPVTGAPAGVICFYTEAGIAAHGLACPVGWTRFTALDSKFPWGEVSGQALDLLGADQHTHTYMDVPAHIHSCAEAAGLAAVAAGNHVHNYPIYTGPAGSGLWPAQQDVAYMNTTLSAGLHQHAIAVPARTSGTSKRTDTSADGIATGTTSEEDNLSLYHTVVWCEKD